MNYRSSVNDVIDRENKRRARSIFFCAVSLCAFIILYIYMAIYSFLAFCRFFSRLFSMSVVSIYCSVLYLFWFYASVFSLVSWHFLRNFFFFTSFNTNLSFYLSLTISPSISHHLNIYA